MAIARRSSQTTVSSVAGTTADIALPSDARVGDFAIVIFGTNTVVTITQPTGWIGYDVATDGSVMFRMLTRLIDGTEAGIATFSLSSSSDWAGGIALYTGVSRLPHAGTGYKGAWTSAIQDYITATTESGTDTNTAANLKTNQHADGWQVTVGVVRHATTGWTTCTATNHTFTKVFDVASSGATPVSVVLFDTNGPSEVSTTARSATMTTNATSAERIIGGVTLRPEGGINRVGQAQDRVSAAPGTSVTIGAGGAWGIPSRALCIIQIANNANATVTPPAGWTVVNETADGVLNVATLLKYASGTESGTVTATLSVSADWTSQIAAFTGVAFTEDLATNPTTPFYSSEYLAETGTDTTITTGSLTTDGTAWRVMMYSLASATAGGWATASATAGSVLARVTNSASSGTTKVQSSYQDSNGPVPIGSSTTTCTSTASTSDKVAFTALLKPAGTPVGRVFGTVG